MMNLIARPGVGSLLLAAWLFSGLHVLARAQAPDWALVVDRSGTKAELDQNSVRRPFDSDRVVAFTWRRTDSLYTTTNESYASCRTFELTNVQGTQEGRIVDSKISFDYATHPLMRQLRTSFGHLGELSVTGKLIRAACVLVNLDSIKELESPDVYCSAPKNPIEKLQCRLDRELSGNISLLLAGTDSLKTVCGESESKANEVFVEYMMEATVCETLHCAKEKVRDGVSLVTTDLERAKNQGTSGTVRPGTCVAAGIVEQRIKDRQDRALSDDAFQRYIGCARSAVSRMDDRKSGADVVSKGLHGACLEHFNEVVRLAPSFRGKGADTLYRSIEPRLIQLVLEARAQPKVRNK